jgi:hypothetical protein
MKPDCFKNIRYFPILRKNLVLLESVVRERYVVKIGVYQKYLVGLWT